MTSQQNDDNSMPTTTPPPELWREFLQVKNPDKKVGCKPKKCCETDFSNELGTNDCLIQQITAREAEISKGESAKSAKDELTKLRVKVQEATKEYTTAKFDELKKKWIWQDEAIADLIKKIPCAVSNWQCVIECYVCPLLNELYIAELELLGDPKDYCNKLVPFGPNETKDKRAQKPSLCDQYKEYRSLIWNNISRNHYDKLEWLQWDHKNKDRLFQRIKDILTVWEKPAANIEKVLTENDKLIKECSDKLHVSGSKVVYDILMKLLPKHLAIRPTNIASKVDEIEIDKEDFIAIYQAFCSCQDITDQLCHGVNVAELSFRERLIGIHPKLIDPKEYSALICKLATEHYSPAQVALAQADAAVKAQTAEIKRLEEYLSNGLKDFEERAKHSIPDEVPDCKCRDTPCSEERDKVAQEALDDSTSH